MIGANNFSTLQTIRLLITLFYATFFHFTHFSFDAFRFVHLQLKAFESDECAEDIQFKMTENNIIMFFLPR